MSDEKKPLPAETSAQEAPEKEEPKKGFSLFGQLHKVSPQQQAINEKNAKHKKELQDDLALKKAAWLKDQAVIRKVRADYEDKIAHASGDDKKTLEEDCRAAELSAAPQARENFAAYQADLDALRAIRQTYRQDLVDKKVILSLHHVKEFFDLGGGYKTKAVHDVSFDVKEGECFGLVGESGCGKTTTGRCIIKLYDITSGSIYYKGYRISAGARWNEKEIKWSKIHTKEKTAQLKKEEASAILKGHIDTKELDKKIADLEAQEASDLAEKNDPTDDDNEALIASIKATYEAKIKALKDEKEAALTKGEESYAIIRARYTSEIKALREQEKLHVLQEKEEIEQIKYDNKHGSKIRIEDPLPASADLLKIRTTSHRLLNEIQMIFQDPVDSLDPRMTVEDIIQEGLHIQGQYNKEENHQKCVEILKKVGLIPEYASRYPHEFSGGQRQRIGIARALIMNPKFLICDEPISALDVSIRAQIINLLNDIKEEMGLTMIFIAHDLSVVKYFCDRIAVMYYGNIVELATATNSSSTRYIRILGPFFRPSRNRIPSAKRTGLVYNPAKAHDYSKEQPTLREIRPGHLVLANSAEFARYEEEIEKLDAAGHTSVSETLAAERESLGTVDGTKKGEK
jgi:oligopeptide transport system ATP-binding protein